MLILTSSGYITCSLLYKSYLAAGCLPVTQVSKKTLILIIKSMNKFHFLILLLGWTLELIPLIKHIEDVAQPGTYPNSASRKYGCTGGFLDLSLWTYQVISCFWGNLELMKSSNFLSSIYSNKFCNEVYCSELEVYCIGFVIKVHSTPD